jgi:bifunctional non-homologous end joining protein LigD
LAAIVGGSDVLLSSALEGDPDAIEAVIRELKLEGVVAKRRRSIYRPGQRTEDWIKVKFSPRQEFVIGGYKPNGRSLDSLVVGYYEKRNLHFAAQVSAGLTRHLRREFRQVLEGDTVVRCPFIDLENASARSHWRTGIAAVDMASFTWLKPRRVVEVSFVEWTNDGVLRHPRFVGLRDDKPARTIHRET